MRKWNANIASRPRQDRTRKRAARHSSRVLQESLSLRWLEFGDAAVRRRPSRWFLKEFFDFGENRRREGGVAVCCFEHIPPGHEVMQIDADVLHQRARLGKNIIEKINEGMVAALPGVTQGFAEIDLAAS